jgi:hypothetical protein
MGEVWACAYSRAMLDDVLTDTEHL